MACFVPFRGARYSVGEDVSALACPPYDIIGEAGRAKLLETCADNIISVELPIGDERRYIAAADKLKELFDSGVLICDDAPHFYVYQMEFEAGGEQKSVAGIVGRMKLYDYGDGVVLPHEHTLPKAKDDRLSLLKACRTNISSVYSLVRDEDSKIQSAIDEALQGEPLCFAVSDGVRHSLYEAADDALISELFEDKKIYIADGHHRYETGLNYKKHLAELGIADPNADYIMMTCVPASCSGLVILPTHRIIKRAANGSDFLLKMRERFDVEPVSREDGLKRLTELSRRRETAFLCCDRSGCHLLTLRDRGAADGLLPNEGPAVRSLDVSALHALCLCEGFGITPDMVTSGEYVEYTRDESEAFAAVENGAPCCFIINPTLAEEILDVADEGGRMPQKSTYFYPKLITGLVINPLD